MGGISIDNLSSLSPDLQKAFQTSVQAQRKPIDFLNQQKAGIEKKVEALNQIINHVEGVKSVLPNLDSPLSIRELAVLSADDRIISGTVDKKYAEPGTYNLEVLQLATQASAISNGFADRDSSTVGTGYFSVTTPSGETKEIFIDAENATLDGLAALINQSSIGLRASVINDQADPDAPFHLLLSANGIGANNTVEYPEFYFIDGDEDFYVDREKPATNALIRFEGFDIESPSNEINDLIRGVALNLKGLTDPNRPTTITVNQDIPKTAIKVKDLVDRLNQVFTFVQDQNTLDPSTQTLKTLGGDYGLRLTEQRLRKVIHTNFLSDENARAIRSFSDLGVQFTKNGTLSLDQKKLENALNAHYDEVAAFLAGDEITTGIVPQLNQVLQSLSSKFGGVLSSQRQNFGDRMGRIQKDINAKEQIAQQKQEALKLKLARAQSAISTLQKQGAAFTQSSANQDLVTTLLG